jgi:hypothetical protein
MTHPILRTIAVAADTLFKGCLVAAAIRVTLQAPENAHAFWSGAFLFWCVFALMRIDQIFDGKRGQ